MYCLCTQRLLFTIDAAAVQDIKFSGPYVLIVKHKKMGQLPIQMLSTSSGQVRRTTAEPAVHNSRVSSTQQLSQQSADALTELLAL